ncbi:Alpha/Beta hydrolase protein [Polychytrium aggregatum]|uniref:Alpha/Beta hydrolase protein n=1 Tax=Polychytrium aggregatum TaxID=110093 RepID=UPI0022FEE2BE|nr:Alpha/Beta hydrolase protein [Polychytrium aggregatum]KAI9207273.1 Alpha/Beta hydrolase protein [Polychytrium aggregatum]
MSLSCCCPSPSSIDGNDTRNAREYAFFSDLKSSDDSPTLQLVQTLPRPSHRSSLLNIIVGGIRSVTFRFQGSVSMARHVTKILSTPPPLGVRITSQKIECIPDLFEGSSHTDPRLAQLIANHSPCPIRAYWLDPRPLVSFGHSRTSDASVGRVTLYFHGGAYFLLSPRSHQFLTGKLAKLTRSRVIAIDYSLAPERPFPCALRDAISAYRFLIDPPPGATHPRYDPKNIVFAGDSAGGGLAIAAALWLRDDERWPLPGGLVLDLTHSMPSFDNNARFDMLPDFGASLESQGQRHFYTTNDLLDHPYVSPLFATKIPAKPLPPTLITVGSAERLRDEGIKFWSKFKGRCLSDDRLHAPHQVVIDPEKNMSDVGSESDAEDVRIEVYQDMPHVFQMFPFERLARMSVCRISEFITAVQGTDTGSSKVDPSSPGAPGSKASSPDGSNARVGGSRRNRITFIRHNGDVVV